MDTTSTTEAATLLGVSAQTIRDRIDAGDYPGAVMIGGNWRIPRTALAGDQPRPAARPAPRPAPRRSPLLDRLAERVADAAAAHNGLVPVELCGVGVKAMRAGLRNGTIPGGRKAGSNWYQTTVGLHRWLDLPTFDTAAGSVA